MDSPETRDDQQQRLVIRPHLTRAIAYLVCALLSLSPIAFGKFWFIHYAAAYAIATVCSFLPATILNRREGTVRSYYLIRLPIRRSLGDFKVVTIVQTDKQDACYRVSIECPSDPFVVVETKDYSGAREYSEKVAAYLDLNIRDEALGRTTFHRRRRSAPEEETEISAHKASTEQPELDRTLVLAGLDVNEILEIRRHIGFDVYLGSGLLSLMAIFGLWYVPQGQGAGWMVQMMQAFFAFLLAASVWNFLSHRGGTILVRDVPYVLTWKAVRLRMLMKIRPLKDFDRVTLSYEPRVNEKGKQTLFYCIRLDGGSVPVTILEIKDDTRAARTAAEVAEFLSLPVDDFMEEDSSKGLLRTKVLSTESDLSISPPPADMPIEYERRDDEFIFKLPARGFRFWKLPLLAAIFLPVITIGLVVLTEAVNWQPPPPQWFQTTVWIVCIASCILYLPLLLALVLPFMRTLSRREQIHVSPQSLRVRSRALDKTTDQTMPSGDLTDITIGSPASEHLTEDTGGLFAPDKVIRACGNVHTLEFGGNLSHEERTWLRKTVIAILLADQSPDD